MSSISPVYLLSIICVLVVLITARPNDPASVQDKTELNRLFIKNLENMHKFRCLHPQPRAISAEDILGTDLLSSEIPHPPSTVLHRCDAQTGCCIHNQECGPLAQETVTLIFKTLDRLANREVFKTATVYNHTRCGCQANDQPKR